MGVGFREITVKIVGIIMTASRLVAMRKQTRADPWGAHTLDEKKGIQPGQPRCV